LAVQPDFPAVGVRPLDDHRIRNNKRAVYADHLITGSGYVELDGIQIAVLIRQFDGLSQGVVSGIVGVGDRIDRPRKTGHHTGNGEQQRQGKYQQRGFADGGMQGSFHAKSSFSSSVVASRRRFLGQRNRNSNQSGYGFRAGGG